MTISQQDWFDLKEMRGAELKARVFSVFTELSRLVQTEEQDDPAVLSAIPRLVDLIGEKPELHSYREALGTLASSVGLWNYIDKTQCDAPDGIVAEAATLEELNNIVLHREQIRALDTLQSGRNLILSAPTSFGKSLLIDVLLLQKQYRRVAIVLPTIALLDEFRRKLTTRFRNKFQIIMYNSEVAGDGNVIFLGTQERMINRSDLGILDLAVVDEFYKLDPNRQDDRSFTLNAAVYQLLKRAKQFFFLGPNIDSVKFGSDSLWKFEFIRTRFATVAVDTFDLRGVDDKPQRLLVELGQSQNRPALVFVSSPDKANRLAADLATKIKSVGDGNAFADWIASNFGPEWELSAIVRSGIGVHHGRIPRAVASHFVRLFNLGTLPIMLCTSTLIEGVNTAAKSVFIFDKDINRSSYDFFTFSNIKGRAGRLGQHQVGSVFLFNAPPSAAEMAVEPPLFADLDDAPDELVVYLSDSDNSDQVDQRRNNIASRLGLASHELKIASAVGLEDASALKRATEDAATEGAAIFWSGFPRYPDIEAVCAVICEVRPARTFGLYSHKQLAFFIKTLRSSQTVAEFFFWYTGQYKGSDQSQDNIFKFLRACEYGLPQLFSVVELFAKKIQPYTNYSLFIAEMPNWFRPGMLKNLDEQGVPIQISERFIEQNDNIDLLSDRIKVAAQTSDPRLSEFEREWILSALP